MCGAHGEPAWDALAFTLFPGRRGPQLPREADSEGPGLQGRGKGLQTGLEAGASPLWGCPLGNPFPRSPSLGPALPKGGFAFPQAGLPDMIHRWPRKHF